MNFNLLRQIFYEMSRRTLHALIINGLFIGVIYANDLNAQQVKSVKETSIEIQFENASLMQVFQIIEAKTNYDFSYKREDLDRDFRFTAKFENASVADVLLEISKQTGLKFKQVNNNIHISKKAKKDKKEEFLEILIQNITITGKVTSAENNQGLPGVNVFVKGTSIGTVTDVDGNYSLDVPKDAVIVFSFIGYVVKEIPINNRSIINVTLEADVTSLNEVVITSFGIKKKKSSVTYSTESVNTEKLAKARELNVINSLTGKVAGLRINESGNGLGSESRVILRGNRSISGDSQPLYVIDGVPIRGSISTINQDNIASISVLKGPNAAALYGSQAQNGVIIIETKKGKEGVVDVSLNSTFMAGKAIILLDLQDEYGQGVSGIYNRTSEESWGPKMEGQMVDHWSPDPELTNTQYAFLPRPDNYKKIFQSTYNTSTGLTASLGNKNLQSSFTYTRTDAKGLMPNNKLGRHNISLRVNNTLTKWLSLDSKISYMQQKIDNINATGDTPINPYRNIYRIPRNIRNEDMAKFEYTTIDGSVRQNYWNPGSTSGKNPYWVVNRMPNFENRQRIIALFSLKIDFTEDLSLTARTSYDGTNNKSELKTYEDSYSPRWTYGYYRVSKNAWDLWNSDLILSYTKNFSKNWNFDGLIGGTLRKTDGYGSLSANTTEKLLLSNFFSLSNTSYPAASFHPSAETETQSVYFSGNIGWKNAIYMNVTGRNDWSSTLPSSHRSYFYPSVGLSAVLSSLFKNFPEVISFAKLRASWAQVGSSAPPYMLTRTANFGPGGYNGFLMISSVLPNENLKPETTNSIELGLDFRFFTNRLGLDLTFYKTNTFDQLFTIALPVGSGASSYFTNGGDVENKGVEILLSGTPVQTGNFTWDININFFTNRNWVNKISDDRPKVVIGGDTYFHDLVVEQGQEFGDIYTRGWARDEQGRVIVDSNGLPEVTSGKTVKVANFNPDWAGGISNTLSYKNITLNFLIDHRQGGSYGSSTDGVLYGDGVAQETVEGREGGLIFGQNLFPNETAVLEDGSPNNIAITAQDFWRSVGGRNTPVGEAFIRDATNTRLRELTLGYSLPESILEKLHLSALELSLVGRNLFFIYIKGNWDPEILPSTRTSAEGFQAYVPPSQRSLGFNIRIGL